MTRRFLSGLVTAAALSTALTAAAQTIPQSFTFTARVANADGPLDGTHQFILRMYDAATGGSKLWEESHIDVQVTGGLVTLAMGSENNITNGNLTDAGVWVEVVVDGSTLSPRIQLRAVPYARRSQDAVTLRGNAPSAFATAAHNHDAAYVNAGGDSMSGALSVDSGGLNVLGTGGVYSHIPYWPNGYNYLTGNGTILRSAAGTEHTWIYSNGNMSTAGDSYANSFIASSDRRLKKNIQPLAAGLDRILQLRPVSYEWKAADRKGTHYGFIAQEVEQVIPAAVTQNDKGYKAIETTAILPVAVKGIQQLKAENDRLRADVDRLAAEVEALKAGRPLPGKQGTTASRWIVPVGLGGSIALVFAFGALATVGRRRRKEDV